jgi:hypothetical protein
MMRTPAMVAAARSVAESTAIRRERPEASMTDAMVNPSGTLCRMMATKMSQPRALEMTKPEAMATPSKKEWAASPQSTE